MRVANGQNTAADFFMFTEVPKAARVVGFVNNDLAAEFRSGSPIFGEKTAPAWIPVSFQDWQGNEIARVYTDEWGSYNALLPSTFTINPPLPTGVSPNMITVVLNHPIRPDGSIDPFYDPRYSVTPWTFDFWPGKTTYLDTPLVPVAAMTGYPANGPDLEFPDGIPVIKSVRNENSEGPVVCNSGDVITITSMGNTEVPNPDFDPSTPGSPATIQRDYGFGNVPGMVILNGNPLSYDSWTNSSITITASDINSISTGQLIITRGDNGKSTQVGITLHVSNNSCSNVKYVSPGNGTPIQDVIDSASDGDLIIVGPGIYRENVILYKDIKLQGSGAGSTIIFANPSPAERLRAWHQKVRDIYGSDPFLATEAPGILVLGQTLAYNNPPKLIDGLQIFGAIAGGGIYVYDSTDGLIISNNKISGNQGTIGGGIAIGSPDIDTTNINLVIRNNQIIKNGGIQGGGGIAIYSGSDNYTITENLIGGNFSRFNGGGIAHNGLSNNGMISKNKIVFNEVAFGGASFGDGAGIYIGGLPPALNVPGPGSGSVTIDSNLIQGNLSGTGSGAGISARYVNGTDAENTPYSLIIVNNIIVNNVAGYAGGGIFLQDVINASIINNTIANNDSTATAANAFMAGGSVSLPQGAGIVSNIHSIGLSSIVGEGYSDPVLQNNIIYNNRSFTFDANSGTLTFQYAWDLEVKGMATPSYLSPEYCLLTTLQSPDGGDYSGNGNISSAPSFIKEYLNNIITASVIDEGGNFVTVRFTPLKIEEGDYHIKGDSPAVDAGTAVTLSYDYDGDTRPSQNTWDIGADELTIISYTITATAGTGGTISPAGQVRVPVNTDQTFTITPDVCYNISDVIVDGQSIGIQGSYTFTNVQTDHTISASFAIKTYTITASAGTGGSISPSGSISVDCGSSMTFNITPGVNYIISDVLVDGVSVGAVSSYTFSNIQGDHSISVSFRP
ncbi:MAG: choice-of-anchor Q domain-containing protein, partial [Candidatus Aenigmatarchaeota archaeon]